MQNLAVVYFPSASLEQINGFRQKYDPGWNIIDPHLTVVSPIADISENRLSEHIEKIIKDIKPFQIELSGLIKSYDNYLFLQVKKGNEKIVSLRNKLYTGILTSYVPTNVPFSPHLTLGAFNTVENIFNKELYEKAYLEAEKMKINISDNFNTITLIKGDGLSPATILTRFQLK